MSLKTLAAIPPVVITGAGTQPFKNYLFDVLSVSSPTVGDQVLTPVIDLNTTMPHCNRITLTKYSALANGDTLELQGSADSVTWYDLPQFNSNAMCNLSTANANVELTGLATFRYVRGSLILATSIPATLKLVLALMRN